MAEKEVVTLGTLHFEPAPAHPELVSGPTAAALSVLPGADAVGVSAIDPTLSDTAAFCEHYQIGPELAANCVIVEGKRGEERQLAAVVILASTRADVNGKVRQALDAKKVSFAQMEKAVQESAMEFGAITPVGLPASWPILIDKAVADTPYVIIGSGIRSSKLAAPGAFLASLPNARVIDGLAQPRTA